MSEAETPPRDRTEDRRTRTKWFAGRSDRLAILALGTILALTPVLGTTALAGSGGTGTGDGGGGGGGGDGDGTPQRFERMWNDFSRKDKRWAHRTSQCESGQQAKIHGGGGTYHGAFQFMLSTWRSAPKSPDGDPHRRSWKTQAVVAVKLKHRDGARTHWPNCG